MAAINSRDEPSWLVAAVSERLSGSTLLFFLHSLPQAAPSGQHLPLHLPKSLTSGSFSCCQSLVLPSLMVRYSGWQGYRKWVYALKFIMDKLSFVRQFGLRNTHNLSYCPIFGQLVIQIFRQCCVQHANGWTIVRQCFVKLSNIWTVLCPTG